MVEIHNNKEEKQEIARPVVKITRGIILNNLGQVLLQKRAAGTNVGDWELPGGKLDPGEKEIDGIRREVREETGLKTTSVQFYLQRTNQTNGERSWDWQVSYFIIETENDLAIINPKEVSEVGYFNKEQIDEMSVAFGHREVIMQFFEERT